jgi:voltage-gated potassium channel
VSTQAPAGRTHVRTWYERLTLLRAIRTIVILATLLMLAGGVLVRVIEPEKFTSLGLAWWWSVETVTTVGYGDYVPASAGGRLVGSALMLSGICLIPLVTSVVVSLLTLKRTQVEHDEQMARLARIEERLDQLGR